MGDLYVKGKKVSGTVSSASAVTYKDRAGNKHTLQKVLDNIPVNNNLLINSNFANPVNQRGLNAYNWMSQYGGYCIDRWRLSCKLDEDITVTINDGYINFIQTGTGDGKFGYLEQKVEFPTKYSGKTLTFSMKYRVNSKSDKLKPIFLEDGKSTSYDVLICDGKWHTFSVKHTLGTITDWFSVAIWGEQKFDIDLEWAKLELGEVATPYVPRLYAEELELCQRYYQIIHNNLFPWSATTSDMVFHQHFKPMRITPTISIIEAAVYLENQKQNGFTFRTDYKTNRRFNLYATKSSHGLKGKAYVGLFLNVTLDAEL